MKKIFLICLLLAAGTAMRAQDETLKSYLNRCVSEQQSGFLVMAKLMQATGLCDSVDAIRDNVYENLYQRGIITYKYDSSSYGTSYSPEHRYFGFTLFAEPDTFWETALGKSARDITPADVQAYIMSLDYDAGTNDSQYDAPQNALFRFVSYHLLPTKLPANRLVLHVNELGYNASNPSKLGIPVMEFYTTMGERRLLKTYESQQSGGVCLNRFPEFDNSRQGSGMEISCDPDKQGVRVDTQNAITLINAILYPIDGLLTYDIPVQQNLGRSRLRFDLASLFPELTNNSKRLNADYYRYVLLPFQSDGYNYLDGVWAVPGTVFTYISGYNRNWPNYQGDEFVIEGLFDLTMQLPPVPVSGEYELRISSSASSGRSIAQIYLGDDRQNLKPLGLPIDFSKSLIEPTFYYENDTEDDEFNALTDLGMRQHGIMKSPKGVVVSGRSIRDNTNIFRRILTRQTFEAGKTYYLRFKNAIASANKSIQIDYIELCPAAVYDNSYVPEDIW